MAAWKALRIGFVSTMDFFPWDYDTYGLGFNFESYEVQRGSTEKIVILNVLLHGSW